MWWVCLIREPEEEALAVDWIGGTMIASVDSSKVRGHRQLLRHVDQPGLTACLCVGSCVCVCVCLWMGYLRQRTVRGGVSILCAVHFV
eukprot:COSAG01_NODE_3696_length_5785_cov_17.639641_5_plen_88_part_00